MKTTVQRFKNARYKVFSVLAIVTMSFMGTIVIAENMRQGAFNGLNNHVAVGTVTLKNQGDAYVIELGADFVFDGAPDPKIAFGNEGQFDPATLMEPLHADSGAQSYRVPENINPEEFNEIYIWCEKYSVGLAVASIQ